MCELVDRIELLYCVSAFQLEKSVDAIEMVGKEICQIPVGAME